MIRMVNPFPRFNVIYVIHFLWKYSFEDIKWLEIGDKEHEKYQSSIIYIYIN
jgi:hypothetical protein